MASTDEQKGYSKGYHAGIKRGRSIGLAVVKQMQRDELRKQAYLAIAPAVIASTWDRRPENEKSNAKTKMSCVDAFVDEFMKRF